MLLIASGWRGVEAGGVDVDRFNLPVAIIVGEVISVEPITRPSGDHRPGSAGARIKLRILETSWGHLDGRTVDVFSSQYVKSASSDMPPMSYGLETVGGLEPDPTHILAAPQDTLLLCLAPIKLRSGSPLEAVYAGLMEPITTPLKVRHGGGTGRQRTLARLPDVPRAKSYAAWLQASESGDFYSSLDTSGQVTRLSWEETLKELVSYAEQRLRDAEVKQ